MKAIVSSIEYDYFDRDFSSRARTNEFGSLTARKDTKEAIEYHQKTIRPFKTTIGPIRPY